jgi:O-antigen biosynthesis protein WbqP
MKKYHYSKRLLDIIISFMALLLFWPLFLIIAFLIKLESRGPVFFKQRRIGRGKQEFLIYKFRTMRRDTPQDTPTHLLINPDLYINKIGKLLRKTSLDEIPQILNIIKGEMSIIGPRPALWNQLDLVAERDKYGANDLTPGLTGWAQVNGRDELPVQAKAEFDGYYVQKISFVLDLKIFWMTVWNVLAGKGVVEGAAGSATSHKAGKVRTLPVIVQAALRSYSSGKENLK